MTIPSADIRHVVRVCRADLVFTDHPAYDCEELAFMASRGERKLLADCTCGVLAALWCGVFRLTDFRHEKVDGLYRIRLTGAPARDNFTLVDVFAQPHGAFFFLQQLRKKHLRVKGSIFFLPPE